jgi:glutathione peroxidase
MRIFILFVVSCLCIETVRAQTTSIYSFQVDSITGQNTINFSSFQGKKILIVCTASQDTSFSQYEELKQLYQIYKDSLVIVVFPTNSFNSENGSNSMIAPTYAQFGAFIFPVAEKVNVKNPNIHPLYDWLTSSAQNGMLSSEITKPCFKYLINKNGQFRGVYGSRVRPMSTIMRQAIENVN